MARGRRQHPGAPAAPRPGTPAGLVGAGERLEGLLDGYRRMHEGLALANDRLRVAGDEYIGVVSQLEADEQSAPFWQRHGEELQTIATDALLGCLDADDDQGVREVLAAYWRAAGDEVRAAAAAGLSEEDVLDLQRVLGALPAMERLPEFRHKLVVRPGAARGKQGARPLLEMAGELSELVGRLRAAFLEQPDQRDWEDPVQARSQRRVNAWDETMRSVEEVGRAARAALRSVPDPDGEPALVVNLRTTPEVLAEWARRHAGLSGFEPIHPVVARVYTREGKMGHSLNASAVRHALIDGRQVTLALHSPVGTCRPDTKPETLRGRVAEHLGEAGVSGIEVAGKVGSWSSLRIEDEPEGDPSGFPPMPAADLAGRERCNHEGAEWHRSDYGLALLSCRRCARRAVTAVPAHRLPAGHHLAPEGDEEQKYLRLERARASLSDDPRPVESVADLRARDGVVPVLPADYAIGRADAPGVSRGGSLRGALAGRRAG